MIFSRLLRASSPASIAKYPFSRSMTEPYADAFPWDTEKASSTIQSDWCPALNSKNSRDLPTPGSATAATIWPCPAIAISATCFSVPISRWRPTNLV